MLTVISAVAVTAALAAAAVAAVIGQRNLQRWLGAYLCSLWRRRPRPAGPVHVMFCIADHYEPAWNNVPEAQEHVRVAFWSRRLPQLADRHRDADGVRLQYTFFYPIEQYRPEHLDRLADLHERGYGDVEIHLHHDNDTAEQLRQSLEWFKDVLCSRHSLLHRNAVTGRIEYGFIHGNWALDNCGAGGRDCGVNNELQVLRDTGCYADFTLPSAPSDTQTRRINSIYYATDDPARPKSHDTGTPVRVGQPPSGDLLLIQGPLTFNWRRRVMGLVPRIENGEISGDNPPTPQRADLWVAQGIHVVGRPEWLFVKLHTHGANEKNMEALVGAPMERTLDYLERRYNDGVNWVLHYVTAREMFNIVKAAEAGRSGNPGQYRRFCDVDASAACRARVGA